MPPRNGLTGKYGWPLIDQIQDKTHHQGNFKRIDKNFGMNSHHQPSEAHNYPINRNNNLAIFVGGIFISIQAALLILPEKIIFLQ